MIDEQGNLVLEWITKDNGIFNYNEFEKTNDYIYKILIDENFERLNKQFQNILNLSKIKKNKINS